MGLILESWKGFNYRNPVHKKAFNKGLTRYLSAPIEAERQMAKSPGKILAAIEEYTSSVNTAAWDGAQNVVGVFADDIGEADTLWMLAFTEVDLTDTPKSSFDILGVTSGATFEKIPDGHRVTIRGISGSRINVTIDTYGAGLALLQNWFDDKDYYLIEDEVRKYRFEEGDQKATAHYALISAITDAPAYDTLGATTEEKDANTISAACAEMITENDGTDLGVSATTQFLLYTHVNNWARVLRALRTVVAYTPQPTVPYMVRPIPTSKVGTGYLGQLVAPGRKNKHGRRLDLEILEDYDISMRGRTSVGWYRYGAFVNADQVRRVPSA